MVSPSITSRSSGGSNGSHPSSVEAARPTRHLLGDRWFVDETYVKVNWSVDVPVPGGRPVRAGHRRVAVRQTRSDRGAGVLPPGARHRGGAGRGDDGPGTGLPARLDELVPIARHDTERYANNTIEADHGRLKARLRPMRGLKTFRSGRILATGHAFIQNLKRGHYDIATDAPAHRRLLEAFAELMLAI